jgi:hypothetical protein
LNHRAAQARLAYPTRPDLYRRSQTQ